jgi:hypothetical protein
MLAVLKTTNPVDLSFAQALLNDAGIPNVVFDSEMSIMDGSMGFLPRRLMVPNDNYLAAVDILRDGIAGYRPP